MLQDDFKLPQGKKDNWGDAVTISDYNINQDVTGQMKSSFGDRYALIRKIGQGGTGKVYLARDCKLGREVALKQLLIQSGASDKAIARLLSEARALAALQHPNIVTIWDISDDLGC